MQLKQYIKLSQQLKMTPQLQQAIKLLQLSRVELEEHVRDEMLENPVLEEAADSERVREDGTEIEQKPEDFPQSTIDGVARKESDGAEEKSQSEMDWERFVEGYNEYSYSPGGGGVRMNSDELPSIDQTLSEKESLFDHLMWQLSLSNLDEVEQEIAADIIGNVNQQGYFVNRTLEDLAQAHGVSFEYADDVLTAVQEMDPVGVAARDLKECLLIQARTYHSGDGTLRRFIERHLENMEKRNYDAIKRDMDLSHDELVRLAKIVQNMEPKPGRGFNTDETHYITPDVYVHKMGDEYVVTLNEDGLPKLKVSNYYRSAMTGGSGQTKSYIQDKFRSAVWLIRSIHQRQNTIRKVTESIVRFQRDFLDRGPQHLRPLILRDVADDIGMHESTVSRVTTNKYVHTPQGIYELKYFFNSRIKTMYSSDDIASESVKIKIKKLIDDETPKKPLSDQAIANLLKQENIDIARRTVAKYREMMNIPSSSKRKKLF
ncbi:MAG: RNA polymerase factor sigma-54 [Myxococcota bacterium]|nr:RNA polymerase factor sigma-54 [Myxococcota bacterium]